jgi:hypothetical protein
MKNDDDRVSPREVAENPNTTKCVVCGSPLKTHSAKKCTTCNAYQNPFRRLIADADISALTALVSVATVCFSLVRGYLKVPGSQISIDLLGCQRDKIAIVYTNTGNRAGIIRLPKAVVHSSGREHEFPLLFEPGAEGILVKEDALNVTTLSINSASLGQFLSDSCTIDFSAQITDFGGTPTPSKPLTCPCSKIAS